MKKQIAAAAVAIMIGAVAMLVAAAPTSADIHTITKYERGPKASAVTWEYLPLTDGIWNGHVVNNGLRWIVVDVYDNTSGVPQEVMHQRLNLNTLGIMPTGEVDTKNAIMNGGRIYEITVTPNGPRLTSCTVEDMFREVAAPVAVFTYETNNLMVTVDGSQSYDPDGTIALFEWSFGDGATATGPTASHTYSVEGTYIITLSVTDNDGLWDTASEIVDVTNPFIGPAASFVPTMDHMHLSVDASSSTDPDGIIQSYDWTFGDGSSGSGITTSHDYTAEGFYTVTLTVTDSNQLSDSASQQVEAVLPPQPPVASFDLTPDYLVVQADGSGSYDPDGTIVSFSWNFGDGGTAFEAVVTHTYASAGTYTVSLTVVDSQDLSNTKSVELTVYAKPDNPPTAKFTYTVVGLTVYVNAGTSTDDNGIDSYSWDWGDGSPLGSGVTAEHTYVAPASVASMSTSSMLARTTLAPIQPYYINGYTYAPDQTKLGGTSVTVTNSRTGQSATVVSDAVSAYYSVDLSTFSLGYLAGDPISVTAVNGNLVGENSGVVGTGLYTQIDVTLHGTGPQPFDVTITLTVTDTIGQTNSISQVITLTPP